ncbi:MAG: NDP-sugar synthase [Elusimicrobiaceae bacterium]|nr:NDP-sugar synthase [Elusimicrobiaceae bacterium]
MMFQKHAGIFAAGHGTRLQAAFPGIVKPMVPLINVPLIEWTVRILKTAGFEDFTILLNSAGKPARAHLKQAFPDLNFVFLVKDTETSYESFRLVAQTLAQKTDHFLLSTVDSLYNPADLEKFIVSAQSSFADAVLGVTDRVADTKPLWADIEDNGLISRLGPGCAQKKFVTSGIYFLTSALAEQMPETRNYAALREYLADIAAQGKRISSFPIRQSVDVDTPDDIEFAEEFLYKQFLRKPGEKWG